jgi:hypothetical protein
VFIEFNGERLTVSQWARKLGLKPATIEARLAKGWPLSRALSPKLFSNKAKTHCSRGHRYSPKNTRIYRGSRYCLTCER